MIIINSNSMKHYNQPQTMLFQVNAQTMQMQTTSPVGPVHSPIRGQLGTMGNADVNNW